MFGCESHNCVEEFCDKNGVVCGQSSQSADDSDNIRLEKQLESVRTATEWLQLRTKCRPQVAVICGSGLGSFADSIENADVCEYSSIPHFVRCTVPGHAGRLVFGSLGGVEVVAMQGRVHAYEGHSMWQLTFPVRVVASLGVKVLIATNACGSLNRDYNVGDFVIISDHINLPGLVGLNPLTGLCDDRFGPRFPCMTDAYDRSLRLAAWRVARQLGFEGFMREGVSLTLCGPSYETPAELRMIRTLGADVVGMSTAPEVIVARQCGLRCFALALVTNVCITADDNTSKSGSDLKDSSEVVDGTEKGPNHEEVLSAGLCQADNIQLMFRGLITEIDTLLKNK